MKKIGFISLFLMSILTQAQKVNWVTFEELSSLTKQKAKPIMVFIHTDWCKYCLMQEQSTFSDSAVVSNLNDNYYCVKLNAETEETILFLNRDYNFNGSQNELSWVLGAENNQLLFPTTVVLSPQFQITNRWVGHLSKQVLLGN